MRVLIVGEGKHELGDPAIAVEGALIALSKRLNRTITEVDCDLLKSTEVRIHAVKGRSFFKRAVRWMFEAQKRKYDALILIVDEDGDTQRRKQVDEAQESAMGIRRRALGIAIKSFDAWMLADEGALTKTLGVQIDRQKAPEEIANPKAVCEALLGESAVEMGQTQMYAAIAKCADLGNFEERCPLGFARFAERVRQL